MVDRFAGIPVGALLRSVNAQMERVVGGGFPAPEAPQIAPFGTPQAGGSTAFGVPGTPGGAPFGTPQLGGGSGFAPPAGMRGSPFGYPGGAGGSPFATPGGLSGNPFDLVHPAPPQPATSTSTTASGGGYGAHEQYRALITQYAAANNIDPDALAAILKIETPGGDPHSVSSAGAMGLGQIMPGTWAGLADPGDDPYDPAASIKNAAKYYAGLYKQFGDYGLAAAAYQGGPGAIVNGQPRDYGGDGNMTPAQYAALFRQYYAGIKANPLPVAGAGGTGGLAGITPGYGGGSIMQEFGPTEYASNHPDTYAYGNAYGLAGSQHPGVDWAVPMGTNVATPVGGTVYVVGNDHGSGYYYTNTMSQSDPNHSGEFAVMLDNGDVLILGHMSNINVQVGQRVTAGQLIGLSGGSDGAHVHVEYRRKNPNGGYTIIDPRTVLR